MSNPLGYATKIEGARKPTSIEVDGYEPLISAHRTTDTPSILQQLIDYGVRTDGQPLYQGWAPAGLAQGTNGWLIKYYQYNGSGWATSITSTALSAANWTNRTSAVYS